MMDPIRRHIPASIRSRIKSLYYRKTLTAEFKRTVPVFVYQMGKVGSSSVYHSLQDQYAGVVLHGHQFFPKHTNYRIAILYDWVIRKGNPLKVITLLRDPISRNISAFFQNFEKRTGFTPQTAECSISELRSLFLSNYRHEIPLEWLDIHIMENFGIDVYSRRFPENGVACYSNKNVDLLILRSEIRDQEKVEAISDFLGLSGFVLNNSNIGEEKEYADLYKQFLSGLKLPPEYIERMCSSKYFNHFYSNETIEAVRNRWIEKK